MFARALSLCLLALAPAAARAQTESPIYVVQHGRLVGTDDKPLTQPVQLTVTLFASKDENDGTWTDTFDLSPSTNGTYEIVLGTNKQLFPADFIGRKYLGVSIGGTKLEPRLRIGTTPYAARAADAERLGGKSASDYALKADVPTKAADSDKLGGVAAADYALKADVPTKAADSDKLGGKAADLYALKTDTIANALSLGGKAAELFALKTDIPSVPAKAQDSDKLGGVAATTLLSADGKILPAAISGPIPLSILPTGTAGSASGLALLDSSGKLPAAALPPMSSTLNTVQTNVANGQCLNLAHNWGTAAVGYSAWMRDPAVATNPWYPVQPGYEQGTTNLALNQPTSASSYYDSNRMPKNGNDGSVDGPNACIGNRTWISSGGTGWWQVDLGSIQPLSWVRVITGESGSCSWGTDSYDILLSNDGNAFGVPVASGSCVHQASCASWQRLDLPPNTTARYVRFQSKVTGSSGAGLWELEVYGAKYTVSLPDSNNVRFCNYTGVNRDMSLVIWK